MKILVTGASGFVGRALVRRLSDMPGVQLRLALRRVPADDMHDASSTGLDCHAVGDIGAQTDWRAALQGVDCVVHLAARVHVMHDTATDPLAAFRAVNVAGTLALARQATQAGVRRLVYLSSAKVHGEATAPGQAWNEDSRPQPEDPYGISKHEAEIGLQTLAPQGERKMEWVILRPPLVYGPGVAANFQALMGAVRRGLPLPLAGVRNRRSLVALDNLVDAIALCTAHPLAANQVFEVSDQHDLSTPELVRALAAAMGVPARLFGMPLGLLHKLGRVSGRAGAVRRLCEDLVIDSGKISRMLGWRPPLSVAEGMARTVAGTAKVEQK